MRLWASPTRVSEYEGDSCNRWEPGYIGSHVCEALLKAGDSVISLDSYNDFYDPQLKRSNTEAVMRTSEQYAGTCWIEEGDIRDGEFLNRLFARYQIDSVIHLAAYAGVRPSIENPELYVDVNIVGTTTLLEVMRAYGVKRHVFCIFFLCVRQ